MPVECRSTPGAAGASPTGANACSPLQPSGALSWRSPTDAAPACCAPLHCSAVAAPLITCNRLRDDLRQPLKQLPCVLALWLAKATTSYLQSSRDVLLQPLEQVARLAVLLAISKRHSQPCKTQISNLT